MTHTHAQRHHGYKLFPVSAPAPCRLIWRKPCHRSWHISLPCPIATSTPQWVIVPITPYFLSSEGLSCVAAARLPYAAAWHSTHYGLMEVKVFLWLSLASQVPHKTLSKGLITNVLYTNTYRCTHNAHPLHTTIPVSHFAKRCCTFPFKKASILSPFTTALYVAPLLLILPTAAKLFPISPDWSVKPKGL